MGGGDARGAGYGQRPTSPGRDGLADAYRRCQALHRRHGRSYYLATRLLPAWKRRHVHALYGFTRYADEIVDAPDGSTPQERERRLRAWGEAFRAGFPGGAGSPAGAGSGRVAGSGGGGFPGGAGWRDDPLLPAVLHTVEVFRLDRADFDRFLGAMAMDLTVRRYRDYPALLDYMAGSAGAIGTMMLPILLADTHGGHAGEVGHAGGVGRAGGVGVEKAAREPARQLGLAFQLTNFIRDIAEDLSRDRVYLPEEDLDRFGVTVEDLRRCARRRAATAPVRELVAFEVARAREHYALAAPGVTMLPTASQACIRAAYRLYGGILGEIVRAGYDVFGGRVRVSVPRRLALAAASLATPPGRPVSPFDL